MFFYPQKFIIFKKIKNPSFIVSNLHYSYKIINILKNGNFKKNLFIFLF